MEGEDAIPRVHARSTLKIWKVADLKMGRAATFMIHRRLCIPDVSAAFLVHGKWSRDAPNLAAWVVANYESNCVLSGSEFERVAVGKSFGA